MIPRSKHVVIFILIILAALGGLLFARVASGIDAGPALVLDSAAVATATPTRVETGGDSPDARREAARAMMLEKLKAQ